MRPGMSGLEEPAGGRWPQSPWERRRAWWRGRGPGFSESFSGPAPPLHPGEGPGDCLEWSQAQALPACCLEAQVRGAGRKSTRHLPLTPQLGAGTSFRPYLPAPFLEPKALRPVTTAPGPGSLSQLLCPAAPAWGGAGNSQALWLLRIPTRRWRGGCRFPGEPERKGSSGRTPLQTWALARERTAWWVQNSWMGCQGQAGHWPWGGTPEMRHLSLGVLSSTHEAPCPPVACGPQPPQLPALPCGPGPPWFCVQPPAPSHCLLGLILASQPDTSSHALGEGAALSEKGSLVPWIREATWKTRESTSRPGPAPITPPEMRAPTGHAS